MNDSKQSLWEKLEQTLARLESRIGQVENRLAQIDQRPRPMFTESHVVEAKGLLGGRELLTSSDNSMIRVMRQPVCDKCGKAMRLDEEEYSICSKCNRKLCKDCGIKYRFDRYCLDCLRLQLPVDKDSYKVLVAIANDIDRVSVISKLTKISRNEVKDYITKLLAAGLISRKGVAVFSKLSVSSQGLEAIAVFRPVYGMEEDFLHFDIELRKHQAILPEKYLL